MKNGSKKLIFSGILYVLMLGYAYSQNFAWAKQIAGPAEELVSSIATDANGNVITSGGFKGTPDFDPGAGTFTIVSVSANAYDIFVSKLGPTGNFLWAVSIGNLQDDEGMGVKTDAAGNVYVTGYFSGTADFDPSGQNFLLTSNGQADIFVLKLDPNGNFVWAVSLGAFPVDKGMAIVLDGSNNVYVTGSFGQTVDFDPGAGSYTMTAVGVYDAFVLKLNSAGNFVWAKRLGGCNSTIPYSICVDPLMNVYSTGYYVTGTGDFDPGAGTFTMTPVGASDIYISKLDGSGNFVWAASMGGTNTDLGMSLVTDAAGDVYSTGYYSSSVADFDPGAGTYTLNSASGAFQTYISKLSSTGNFIWAKKLQEASAFAGSYGRGVALDGSDNVCLTGSFGGTIDFDPGAGTYTLSSNGNIFVSKLTNAGNFLWAEQMTTTGSGGSSGYAIASNAMSDIFTTGSFTNSVDFDPGSGTYTLTSTGSYDMYISKLSCTAPTITAVTSNTLICAGQTVTLTAGGASTYTWNTGSNSASVTVTPTLTTTYSISARDQNGCQNSTTITQSVAACTAITEISFNNSGSKIIPNPNNGEFMVEVNSVADIVSLEIYNSIGEKVYQTGTGLSFQHISISQYPSGIYYLKISGTEALRVVKFVKE